MKFVGTVILLCCLLLLYGCSETDRAMDTGMAGESDMSDITNQLDWRVSEHTIPCAVTTEELKSRPEMYHGQVVLVASEPEFIRIGCEAVWCRWCCLNCYGIFGISGIRLYDQSLGHGMSGEFSSQPWEGCDEAFASNYFPTRSANASHWFYGRFEVYQYNSSGEAQCRLIVDKYWRR